MASRHATSHITQCPGSYTKHKYLPTDSNTSELVEHVAKHGDDKGN